MYLVSLGRLVVGAVLKIGGPRELFTAHEADGLALELRGGRAEAVVHLAGPALDLLLHPQLPGLELGRVGLALLGQAGRTSPGHVALHRVNARGRALDVLVHIAARHVQGPRHF